MVPTKQTGQSKSPLLTGSGDSDQYRAQIHANFHNYFETHASERDRWKSRAHYYHSQIGHLLRNLIPPGQSVLELGCGTGDLLAEIRPGRGYGIDFAKGMIEIARQKYPKLTFEVADLQNLTVKGQFDYLILSDVIGSLADIWQALRNIRALCRPETRLIITNNNYLWEPILRLAEKIGLKAKQPLQHWLPLPDIENLLYLSGFRVTRQGYCLLLPIWIPGISYLVNRFLAPLPILRRFCLVQYLVARPETEPTHMNSASVSIVVPCLNEEGNIWPLVQRLPKLGAKLEIIFVDGGSTDGTLERIQEVLKKPPQNVQIKLIHQGGKLGKGDAVRKGFASASNELLMILDADLSVAPEDLTKFYLALVEGRGELINGSRLNYPMEDQAMRYLNNMGNKFFGAALSWLLGQRIRDTLCGTKALSQVHYQKILLQRDYFGDFDPFGDFDLLFGAARLGLQITEMPVRYRSRSYGETKISRFRHGLLLARMCWVAMRKLKFA